MQDKKSFSTKPKPACPPTPKELTATFGDPITAEDLMGAMKPADEQADDLQLATVGQAACENWLLQRCGRITASNFHRLNSRMKTLYAKPSEDPKSLLKLLMGTTPAPVTVAWAS